MKRAGFAAVATALVVLGTGGEAEAQAAYRLSPIMEQGAVRALAVELRFIGEADGDTLLNLPTGGGRETTLFRHIADVKASGAQVQATDAPDRLRLVHAPGAEIRVTYRLNSAFEVAPSAGAAEDRYHPMIVGDWFSVLGRAAFIRPDWSSDTSASFAWRGFPSDWTLASDLEHGDLRLGDIGQAILLGGTDLAVTRLGAGTAPTRIALLGDWDFDRARFTDDLSRIMTATRAFWGVEARPFLVALTPLRAEAGAYSLSGTGLADAFSVYASTDAEAEDLAPLLAHEHFHSWMPLAVGGLDQEPEALGYWLSEGFTDFYTLRMLVRADVVSTEEAVRHFNDGLEAYWTSPVRERPNAEIPAHFSSDSGFQRLPYQRGAALAALWDRRLRVSGTAAGLDDVLRAMAVDQAGGDALSRLTRAMAARGVDVAPDLKRHVEDGEMIVLPSDMLEHCGRLEMVERALFHRGFDIDATMAADSVVQGVDPSGPAFGAGLRDGMRLVRREGVLRNDPDLEIIYRVATAEGEKVFAWLPQGSERVTLQRLVASPEAEGERRAQCRLALAGFQEASPPR